MILSFALSLCLLSSQVAGDVAQVPLELHLAPENARVRQGEQLDLVLTITNRSRDPITFITPNFQNSGLRPYYFELLSPEGQILEVEGRELVGANETSGPHFKILDPMTSHIQEIEVNGWTGWKGNYYTLQHLNQKPGTYLLRMRYHPHRASCSEVLAIFFGPDYLETCDDELNRRVWLPPGFILSNSVTVTVLPPRRGARVR